MNKRAFTLLEMLLTLMIMLTLTLLMLRCYHEPSYDVYYFMNDYYRALCQSLIRHESVRAADSYYFNESAAINCGGTVSFANHQVIIHLGNGYLFYE